MKILWFNHFATTPMEGGGTRHYDLAREMTDAGCDVTVVATDFCNKRRSFLRREPHQRAPVMEMLDGVQFMWLWTLPYDRNNWRRFANWLSYLVSAERLALQRPDIVVGSSPHLFGALAAYRAARRLGVPFVFEVRDLWPESLLAGGGRRGIVYHGLRQVADFLYRRADAVMVLSKGVANYVEERGVPLDRIVFLPNGADLGRFGDGVRKPGGASTLRLVYAGAHGPANGLDVVVKAVSLIQDEIDVEVLLVGDGTVKRELVKLAQDIGADSVRFQPPVPKDAIPGLFHSADAGLMVLKEADLFEFGVSPNKLFDYMAAGLPVLCNVRGEVEGIVREAAAGLMVRGSSADALADGIRRFAAMPEEERRRMGTMGRAWVARHRDRRRLAREAIPTLAKIAAGSARSNGR